MQINSYDHERDFNRVGRFLIETYQPGDTFTNWLQPRWEYMHFLPSIKQLDLSKIGIFEQDDQIIGVVHFESQPFQAYFQIRPGFEQIKPQMFDYAEQHFEGISQSTGRMIRALYLNDFGGSVSIGAGSFWAYETGNVAIDSSTFYLDAAANRVGIGTSSPYADLTVDGSVGFKNDTTAMMFAPIESPPIPGVRIYPEDPEVVDKRERGVTTASRTDAARIAEAISR